MWIIYHFVCAVWCVLFEWINISCVNYRNVRQLSTDAIFLTVCYSVNRMEHWMKLHPKNAKNCTQIWSSAPRMPRVALRFEAPPPLDNRPIMCLCGSRQRDNPLIQTDYHFHISWWSELDQATPCRHRCRLRRVTLPIHVILPQAIL